MQLSRYLTRHKISTRKFAAKMGVSIYAVRKWRIGVRLPRPHHINKIKRLTEGIVTHGDWYKQSRRMDK